MVIEIKADGIWFHGSNIVLSELREGSTITQWKELAETFSHQPTILGYDDNGNISHNGKEKAYCTYASLSLFFNPIMLILP